MKARKRAGAKCTRCTNISEYKLSSIVMTKLFLSIPIVCARGMCLSTNTVTIVKSRRIISNLL